MAPSPSGDGKHAVTGPELMELMRQQAVNFGTRIITPDELGKYGSWGGALMTAMPGLTGLWQVSGRSDTSYDERVNLDMTYVHNWSLWMDIKIILRTVPAVLRGDGAY